MCRVLKSSGFFSGNGFCGPKTREVRERDGEVDGVLRGSGYLVTGYMPVCNPRIWEHITHLYG